LAKSGAIALGFRRIINTGAASCRSIIQGDNTMNWQTPAYCEIRLGFEVTAYVYVR
jgi:pyrroloquinoline quinone biosynthesis protein A